MTYDEIQALMEKYKDRDVRQELIWTSHYLRGRNRMSNEDKGYYKWLAMAAFKRIEELEGWKNE